MKKKLFSFEKCANVKFKVAILRVTSKFSFFVWGLIMLDAENRILIAKNSAKELCILPEMANRHGLITGATGTGKTVTLQTMAESFSAMGVPVFMTDIKGDLSGVSAKGSPKGKVLERVNELKLAELGYENKGFPVCFWDAFGKDGHPLRVTVSEMGPVLLSRLLNLNDVQSGVLNMVFRIADDDGMLLLDFKDLRAMVQHVGEHKEEYLTEYGQISAASVGAIQRALLKLEQEGAATFFGEPALDIFDLLQTDDSGRGVINVLAADALMNAPRVYSMLLLWLLAELFEKLPEVGDAAKPKLVFFFDEAHMLFSNATPELLEKIEQVVRLIRSRGVGVYFVTQNPADVPDAIASQLGNRVQHALRAFTPKEQKAVKVAAESFRANPAFSTERVIGELAVGEALVSFLDHKGRPNMVERAYVLPPEGQVGPITRAQRKECLENSLVAGVYDEVLDRESAYEILFQKATVRQQEKIAAEENRRREKEERQRAIEERRALEEEARRQRAESRLAAAQAREEERQRREEERAKKNSLEGIATSILMGAAKSAVRSAATSSIKKAGTSILRGVLGNLFK